jgi:hypothetical protein
MNKKTLNLVILSVGIVLLILGFNEYGTFGSRVGRFLGAGVSNRILFFFIAGTLCTVYGLLNIRKKK